MTVRWLNQAGAQIATLPPPTKVSVNLFESELGLGSFPPGDYLVEIDAQAGDQTTKRLLAIRVTG